MNAYRAARLVLATAAALVVLFAARSAAAFPWMIRHEYGGCVQCHLDPSGGGILTAYGRAQTEIVLSTPWRRAETEEPGREKDFLFGAVALPDALLAQAWIRNGYLVDTRDGTLIDNRWLQMRADVGAGVTAGALRAAVTVGYNRPQSALLSERASVLSIGDLGDIVSREHWAGVALADELVLLRAGRIALPFGVRNYEHITFVRNATRTDLDQDQQHGFAAWFGSERIRAELMAVLGNFQVHPDAFRDRGYSAYAEYLVASRYAAGVSSFVLHAERDLVTRVETWRQAHGIFARVSPVAPIAVLGEADVLVTSPAGFDTRLGYAGLLQLDYEPLQGLHAIASAEALRSAAPGDGSRLGFWLGALWFPYTHFELRADVIRRTAPDVILYLFQGQLYL